MRTHAGCGAFALALAACQPSDGLIFDTAAGPGSDTAVAADSDAAAGGSADTSASGACDPDAPLEVQGNDPRFSHECGESCDSDWCGCEPCLAASGPLARLAAGAHVLRVLGGVSGVGDYRLTLDTDDGTNLLDLQLTRDGLFDDEFEFSVPAGCPEVSLRWDQQTAVCSRLYEVFVRRP